MTGRRRCYNGWREEYSGYLMSGYYNQAAASEYACVDEDPETMKGGSSNLNGILFYPVTTVCVHLLQVALRSYALFAPNKKEL